MKKLFFLTAITLSTLSLTAQMPQMGNGKNTQSIPNMGHVYGKIMDTSGNPLADVSVMLLQNKFDTVTKKRKDVLIGGLSTKANGEFSFSDLPIMGTLKLKISATGYKAVDQTVAFQMQAPPSGAAKNDPAAGLAMLNAFDKDLGNIKLTTEAKQLEAVTLVASKPGLRMDIDKKVFTVDKDLVSAGGTAVDVMKNVPSVQVDIDGNVKLRNASPQIYIEGRPTTLTLDQIPADAIESVEVITNPSAKYDASGGNSGILNIILKKNKKSGYNGNLRAGVDKRGGINGGGDFNFRQGKFNVTASGMINQMRSRSTGTTDRINYMDTPNTHINQINQNRTNGGFMFGRLGMDFFATNRTTFSIAGIRVRGQFDPTESISINTDTLYETGITSSYSERNSTGSRTFNASGLQAGMKHLFPKAGEELTADLNYFNGKNEGYNTFTTDYYTIVGGAKEGTQVQKLVNEGSNRFLTVQTDYVKPLGKKTKLETGLRGQFRKFDNNNSNYYQDPSTGEFVLIPSATNHYRNEENVYAAYLSVGSSINDFGYKLGLRAESSNYNGELMATNEKFSNSYPISLFPSVFLSQKLNNKQELQMSITRRVNRPNFFQLIPFIDYTDKLNITRGNPDLVPEFTSSIESSYMKTFKGNNTFLASVYYKHTDNLITRYQVKEMNPFTGNEELINTFINANSSYSVGTEFTSTNTIKKWLDLTTNLNLYNSKINTNDGQDQDAMWSWFGKINSNFKLPKKYTIQLSGTYQSKTNLPVNAGGGGPFGQSMSSTQGYTKPNYGVDIAFKKSFLKNDAASITFSVNDIFGTRKFDQYSSSPYFVQNYSRLRDPQMFRINFAYRFGKMDASLFKRKNLKAQGEGMQGGMEGMQ